MFSPKFFTDGALLNKTPDLARTSADLQKLVQKKYTITDRETMNKWFLLENEDVRGPYTEEELQAQVQAHILSDRCMFWSKGMLTWKPVSQWGEKTFDDPKTLTQIHLPQQWHYALEGESFGPYFRPELIDSLKLLQEKVSQVLIWTKGLKNWSPIFDFHDLLEELEINRRQHPRALIQGSAVIHFGERSIIAPIKTISQGGFGVQPAEGFLPGQELSVELKSPAFQESLHAKAEVRYVSGQKFVGFKFTSINRETSSVIVQYVKTHAHAPDKAA